ncbi:MAG: dTDP-4-dehydrorhamnose 3,5-epimerase family protein [Anaerolineales bacterium]|nr:MAG: dTDP-4-dehydrorhamnose 3,5-epimerase family protein [Anaerolineales bacterium]
MSQQPPIPDMHIIPLQAAPQGVVLLRETDHVLRRFGELALQTLPAGSQGAYSLRAEADRVLFVIDGAVDARLLDLRPQSPSHGVHTSIRLQANAQALLVPFGVACSLAAPDAARVLWLSTHSQPHAADRDATPDELAQFAAG